MGQVLDFETGAKLTATDKIKVTVFDPFDYAISPKTAKPLAQPVGLDADGCFLVKDLPIPYSGFFGYVIDDSGSDDKYYPVGLTEPGKVGVNVSNIKALAVTNVAIKSWGQQLFGKENGITEFGAYVMGFVDMGLAPINDVTPTMEEKEPPWTYNAEPVVPYFFADDLKTFLPKTTTKTGKSGWCLVTKCPVVDFGGRHSSYDFKAEIGGSTPEMIMFTRYTGTPK